MFFPFLPSERWVMAPPIDRSTPSRIRPLSSQLMGGSAARTMLLPNARRIRRNAHGANFLQFVIALQIRERQCFLSGDFAPQTQNPKNPASKVLFELGQTRKSAAGHLECGGKPCRGVDTDLDNTQAGIWSAVAQPCRGGATALDCREAAADSRRPPAISKAVPPVEDSLRDRTPNPGHLECGRAAL